MFSLQGSSAGDVFRIEGTDLGAALKHGRGKMATSRKSSAQCVVLYLHDNHFKGKIRFFLTCTQGCMFSFYRFIIQTHKSRQIIPHWTESPITKRSPKEARSHCAHSRSANTVHGMSEYSSCTQWLWPRPPAFTYRVAAFNRFKRQHFKVTKSAEGLRGTRVC